MIDREKVVRAVETCFNSWIDKHRNMGLVFDEVEQMKHDALEMLKEYKSIIRCKDCKYYAVENHYGNFCGYQILAASNVPTCHRWGNDTVMVKPDGYCFLGERR